MEHRSSVGEEFERTGNDGDAKIRRRDGGQKRRRTGERLERESDRMKRRRQREGTEDEREEIKKKEVEIGLLACRTETQNDEDRRRRRRGEEMNVEHENDSQREKMRWKRTSETMKDVKEFFYRLLDSRSTLQTSLWTLRIKQSIVKRSIMTGDHRDRVAAMNP